MKLYLVGFFDVNHMRVLRSNLVFANRFDVPLPSIWELSGIYQLEKKEDEPPIIKINPIFHSSELQSNGHKRCDARCLLSP